MPVALTTHSPCWNLASPSTSRQCATTGFSGAPACSLAKWSLQPMSKPQFDGCKRRDVDAARLQQRLPGAVGTELRPAAAAEREHHGVGVHVHFAARAWRSAARRRRASRCQRCCTWKRTPCSRRRRTQPRSSGAALRSVGNTRPELPTKVSTPSPRAHSRRVVGIEIAQPAARPRACVRGSAATKAGLGSEWVRLSPPLPAIRNLRPTEPLASYRSTAMPAAQATSAAISPAGPPPMMAMRLSWSGGTFNAWLPKIGGSKRAGCAHATSPAARPEAQAHWKL